MPLPISPIFYLGKRFKIIPLPTQAKGISVASLHIPNPFEHFYFINNTQEGSGDKEGIKVKPSLNYQLGLENPFLPIFMSEPIGQLQVGGTNVIVKGNEYRPPESVLTPIQPQTPTQPQTPIQPQSGGGVIGIPYTGSGSGTGTQYSGGDIVRIPPPTVPYSPTFAPTKQDISLTPTGTPTPAQPTPTPTTTQERISRREGIFM